MDKSWYTLGLEASPNAPALHVQDRTVASCGHEWNGGFSTFPTWRSFVPVQLVPDKKGTWTKYRGVPRS